MSSSTVAPSVQRLAVTSPAPRAVWREVLRTDRDALVTQSPEWVDALCTVGGYADASRLYEASDGRRLVLPMVRRTRLPLLESMPSAWGFGGPLVDGALTADMLAAVVRDLTAQRVLRVHLRPNPLHAPVWEAAVGAGATVVPRRAHVLDLAGGYERVWQERFTSETRRQARRAERKGVVVECDTSGRLLPVFHQLLRQSFDRWAAQQHEPRALARYRGWRRDPLPKFEAIAKHLGAACQVWVAWHEGRPAATALVLVGANAHDTRGAMDKAVAGPVGAATLLQVRAIEAACAAGCRTYQLGESGDAEGLDHYKGRFGAVGHPYAEYRLERLPLTAADRLLRTAVKRVIGFRDA